MDFSPVQYLDHITIWVLYQRSPNIPNAVAEEAKRNDGLGLSVAVVVDVHFQRRQVVHERRRRNKDQAGCASSHG